MITGVLLQRLIAIVVSLARYDMILYFPGPLPFAYRP